MISRSGEQTPLSAQRGAAESQGSTTPPAAGYSPPSAPEERPVHEARRRWLRVVAILALVGAGLGVAQVWPAARDAQGLLLADLWRLRPVDLALQVALMLVGAFGLRALLPGEED